MKIVHITNDYEERAGVERMITHFMLRSTANQHYLFSLHRLNPCLYEDLRTAPNLVIGSAFGMRWRKHRMVSCIPAFRAALKALAPDCVFSWQYHSNVFAAITCATMQRPPRLVWNVRHSLDSLSAESRPVRIALAASPLLAVRADAVVYNSSRAVAQHAARGFPVSKARYVPNGVDSGRFTRAPRPPAAVVRLGTLARDHRLKNLDGLLDALRPLKADQRWHLTIRGGGVASGRLAARASELGIRERCSFEDEGDARSFLQSLDVFILPSISEGFPNALCEAMACGLSCVSTDVGDARRVVSDIGVIVPREDAAALTLGIGEAMRRAREDPTIGERARAHVVAHLSLDASIAAFEKIAMGQ